MDEKNFTPEESLLIISKTIEETRKKSRKTAILLFYGAA